jgi:hypothetical protein
MRALRKSRCVLALGLLLLFATPSAFSYSVLTHEAIIDSVWDTSIKGLLLKRFPDSTPEQLVEAHAYAYGGSIIQDMGYYPFGSKLFTDLLHYVRSGDFVINLIHESQDLNEYAFSLGALAHYAADNTGHPLATNPGVSLLYPKLRVEFGNRVTYADDAPSHIKTEFAFDVLQVAKGHYASNSYHEFIGFKVAKQALERAFLDTYGIKMGDVFTSVDLSIGSYRRAVSSTIPAMTRVAWDMKKDEIMKDTPGTTRQKFLYNISQSSYQKDWGTQYQKPGFRSKLMAFFLKILPRIGPFRTLRFETPTPEVEKLFMASFNKTLDRYRELLAAVRTNQLKLPNENLDLGEAPAAGKYRLSDQTYARLLDKLEGHYPDMPPELRVNILAFYGDLSAPISTKADASAWEKVVKQLDELKTVNVGKL